MFPDTALGRDRPCTVPHGDGGLPHGQVRRPDDGRRRGIPRGGGSGPGMRSGDARTVHGGGTHPVADAGQAPAALVPQTLRPVPEPLAAARSAPDTRMEILLRYGARPVEREIHGIQVAAGRRRRNSRPNPSPEKAGRERRKNSLSLGKSLPDILDLKIKSYICIVIQRKVYAI